MCHRYWIMGNCLAGESCPFSHDPSALISNVNARDPNPASPSAGSPFQVDGAADAFPPLQSSAGSEDPWANQYMGRYPANLATFHGNRHASPGQHPALGRRSGSLTNLVRPQLRPASRHQNRELNSTAPSVDDPDAFPTLAAVSAKNASKKHHGKRGQASRESNVSRENIPSSVADVVRMSPSPAPGKGKSPSKNSRDFKSRENSAAAQSIPPPQNIPWLETGARSNQQYIKYRTEAIRHGTVRNKFLQRYGLISAVRLFFFVIH